MVGEVASPKGIATGTSIRRTAEVSKTVIRKDGRPEAETPGDVVMVVQNGATLLDGAGGEGKGHDWKAARLVGSALQDKINRSLGPWSNSPVNTGNIAAVGQAVAEGFMVGVKALKNAVKIGELNKGSDTTANVAVVVNMPDGSRELVSANVGDSTTYIRNDTTGELVQVSEEHSLAMALVRAGQLTPEAAITHPQRNVIYRSIGTLNPKQRYVDFAENIALRCIQLPEGWSVLMVSDGVTDNLQPEHLNGLSRRAAAKEIPPRQFQQYLAEHVSQMSTVAENTLAKPDDISAVSIR